MASLAKLSAIACAPRTWRALSQGVAATMEHRAALSEDRFATVIDVGANKGQFATFAANQWPDADLLCFEPLPGPRAKLERVTEGRATIFPYALGATETEAEIHIATREDSSSLLPMGDLQSKLFDMREAETLTVPVRTLDRCLADIDFGRPALLKIDVQGFEREVLAGAAASIARIDVVYVELSFVELYKGQALADEIIGMMQAHGMSIRGVHNTAHAKDGTPIQADFLFRRV